MPSGQSPSTESGPAEVSVVRGDGARRLPVAVAGSLQNPAFSPDDSRLVLTSFVNGYNVGPSEIHVFHLGTETASLLTAAPDSDNRPGLRGPPSRAKVGVRRTP